MRLKDLEVGKIYLTKEVSLFMKQSSERYRQQVLVRPELEKTYHYLNEPFMVIEKNPYAKILLKKQVYEIHEYLAHELYSNPVSWDFFPVEME